MQDVEEAVATLRDDVVDLARALQRRDKDKRWFRHLKDTTRLGKAADGDVPTYDAVTGEWYAAPAAAGAPGVSVVPETTFGQAPALGATGLWSDSGHTHGTPTLPDGTWVLKAGDTMTGSLAIGAEDSVLTVDDAANARVGLVKRTGQFPKLAHGLGAPLAIARSSVANVTAAATYTDQMVFDDNTVRVPAPLVLESASPQVNLSLAGGGGYQAGVGIAHTIYSSGAKFVNPNWVPVHTAGSIIFQDANNIRFFSDLGLTAGTPYAPTERFTIGSSSVSILVPVSSVLNVSPGSPATPGLVLEGSALGRVLEVRATDTDASLRLNDAGATPRSWLVQTNGADGLHVVDETAGNLVRLTISTAGVVNAPTGLQVGGVDVALSTDARFPTTAQKAALVGVGGVPSGTNPYVVDSDPRLVAAGGVSSFNTRTGAVTLTRSDVNAALTPATLPAGESVLVITAPSGTAAPQSLWRAAVGATTVSEMAPDGTIQVGVNAGPRSFYGPNIAKFESAPNVGTHISYVPAVGALGPGLAFIDAATGTHRVRQCDSSAFWDIGPDLGNSNPAATGGINGKHLRIGVEGLGATSDRHMMIFKFAGQTTVGGVVVSSDGLIDTTEIGTTYRDLSIRPGCPNINACDPSELLINSQPPPAGTTLVNGSQIRIFGPYLQVEGGLTGMGSGNWQDPGAAGVTWGGLLMGFDWNTVGSSGGLGVGHIASRWMGTSPGWRELNYWASDHHWHTAGAGTPKMSLTAAGALSFGSTTQQIVNLYGTSYGIGVQANTTYFRSDGGFAWFRDGVHSDTEHAPGAGGTKVLTIDGAGTLQHWPDFADFGTTAYQTRIGESWGDRGLSAYAGNLSLAANDGEVRLRTGTGTGATTRLSITSSGVVRTHHDWTDLAAGTSYAIRVGETHTDPGVSSAGVLRLAAAAGSQVRIGVDTATAAVVRGTATSGAGLETMFKCFSSAIGSDYVRVCHTGAAGNGHIDTVNGGLYLNWYSGGTGGYNVIVGNGAQGYGALLCDTIFRNTEATPSARVLKTGITDAPYGLAEVLRMQPRAFRYKASPKVPRLGFVAEEMAEIIPEACVGMDAGPAPAPTRRRGKHAPPPTPPQTLGIDLSRLTPVLVRAIQELEARLSDLERLPSGAS